MVGPVGTVVVAGADDVVVGVEGVVVEGVGVEPAVVVGVPDGGGWLVVAVGSPGVPACRVGAGASGSTTVSTSAGPDGSGATSGTGAALGRLLPDPPAGRAGGTA
ncbi:hypothetical protein SAMN05660485_03563 [Blastococcus fimeti]|nr:hypothetical protein SAMN05660485_03563 [Blastococcus fimeti]